KPGNMDSVFSNHNIVPDIIVEEEYGEFIVTINDGNVPELRLSKSYENMIMNRDKLDKETKEYLSKKVESAKWFIQSIHQRRNTMTRVMKTIIDKQYDFFMGDADGLKPMILKDIAEIVRMDISTISRVTNGKYVQSPMGLHELKYFFTEGMKDAGGEDVSTRKIKNALRIIIEKENKNKPLNDEKLVKELAGVGYNIARRTVAKYREQLNLPIARLRREI
ncbi:MAG: RNA polymerase sigma-54 factor, partial [Candidatus Marinimicrobia bacterium]|nr:RNA polymerase sigma-54 factor [Candidatus Neomarinimicrobiota bacterium]